MDIKKLQQAASTAINQCLKVTKEDRVIVITDKETLVIGDALFEEVTKVTPNTKMILIEDFTKRPAKDLPVEMTQIISEFNPTVSIYAAQGHEGELQVFRRPLVNVLTHTYNCKHAHMIGIDMQLMEDGMNKDYDLVFKVTNKIFDKLKTVVNIHATDPYGTNITFEIDSKNRNWIPDTGRIDAGQMRNLPGGEVFTCPTNANGTIIAWIFGDFFQKFGTPDSPLKITIKDGYIVTTETINNPSDKIMEIKKEFDSYIQQYKDSNRVGELGIGTLVGLEDFVGNLLQDEKFPGIHVAFGHPYPEETNTDWDCPSHLDVIPKKVTIELTYENGTKEIIMRDGIYEQNILNN